MTDELSQLRQVRSKFNFQSTYLLCRASAPRVEDLRSKPVTIWTLADHPSKTTQDTDARMVSRLFQELAQAAWDNGEGATIDRSTVESLHKRCKADKETANVLAGTQDQPNPLVCQEQVHEQCSKAKRVRVRMLPMLSQESGPSIASTRSSAWSMIHRRQQLLHQATPMGPRTSTGSLCRSTTMTTAVTIGRIFLRWVKPEGFSAHTPHGQAPSRRTIDRKS